MDQPGDGTAAAKRVMADQHTHNLLNTLPQDMKTLIGEQLDQQQQQNPVEVTVAELEKTALSDASHAGPELDLHRRALGNNDVNNNVLKRFCEKHPDLIAVFLTKDTAITDFSPLVGLTNLQYIEIVDDKSYMDLNTLKGLRGSVNIVILVEGDLDDELDTYYRGLNNLLPGSDIQIVTNYRVQNNVMFAYKNGQRTDH